MSTQKKEKLWKQYNQSKNDTIRNELIIEYLPLVKIIASRMNIKLGYTVEYEELESDGIIGLIDAIDKFDITMDIKFETYASKRIQGAIYDEIRKRDHVTRKSRERERETNKFILEYKNKYNGKLPSEEEIAANLNMELDKYKSWVVQMTNISSIESLNNVLELKSESEALITSINNQSVFQTPEEHIDKQDFMITLKNALESLTEKERNVILLYYYEEMTLKEIANIMNVTESRASQLHTKALQKMKIIMKKYFNILL